MISINPIFKKQDLLSKSSLLGVWSIDSAKYQVVSDNDKTFKIKVLENKSGKVNVSGGIYARLGKIGKNQLIEFHTKQQTGDSQTVEMHCYLFAKINFINKKTISLSLPEAEWFLEENNIGYTALNTDAIQNLISEIKSEDFMEPETLRKLD